MSTTEGVTATPSAIPGRDAGIAATRTGTSVFCFRKTVGVDKSNGRRVACICVGVPVRLVVPWCHRTLFHVQHGSAGTVPL